MKVTAVIFDLNGTVLDDEDQYGLAFNKILRSLGIDANKEIPQTLGIGVKENWPLLIEKYNIKTDKTPEVLAHETQEAYLDQITGINVRTGFEEFAEGLKDSGIKIALATSNTWEVVDKILSKVELDNYFEEITTADEVAYTKPDPDLFLLSADKLGVERSECLVVEDAVSGVTAAHRAGMKVVAISRDDNVELLKEADLVVEGFSELSPKVLAEL